MESDPGEQQTPHQEHTCRKGIFIQEEKKRSRGKKGDSKGGKKTPLVELNYYIPLEQGTLTKRGKLTIFKGEDRRAKGGGGGLGGGNCGERGKALGNGWGEVTWASFFQGEAGSGKGKKG